MSTPLEWALHHLGKGYCPIPTIAGTKGAYIPWKPWQAAQPTPGDVEGWWPVSSPPRNIALVCGAFHGLVVVDVDDAESLRFARLHFGPTPYRVATRRGIHFYYRHPGAGIHVQTKARVFGEQGPAIDVRGDGGIATALGSVHAEGHIYNLDEGARITPASDLPLWDVRWVPTVRPLLPPSLDRSSNRSGLERAERYLDTCEGSGKGVRNQNTFRVAASVIRDFGLAEEQGWALLSSWNDLRNDPPLPQEELKAIVHSCLQSGRRPVGFRLNAG
jgi:hypothetical protein